MAIVLLGKILKAVVFQIKRTKNELLIPLFYRIALNSYKCPWKFLKNQLICTIIIFIILKMEKM